MNSSRQQMVSPNARMMAGSARLRNPSAIPKYDAPMSFEDREAIRAYYDELGDAEWRRLEDTPRGRVSLEVHRRFLTRFIRSNARILEVGAGPGRFTMELAALGAAVTVTDISPVQLELHRLHLSDAPAEEAVESRELLDVCDTSRIPDDSFDFVVAFGGPLSYAFEHTDDALAGLFRITKPGGVVLASVMSLLGSWRYFLRSVIEETQKIGEAANELVLTTGDLRHFGGEHVCQMFRSTEIEVLVGRCGGSLVEMSASNWASLADEEVVSQLEGDADRWRSFLNHEVAACAEPGAVDGGTHILFAARRNGSS
jgi:SAM-dependent methyltransferase